MWIRHAIFLVVVTLVISSAVLDVVRTVFLWFGIDSFMNGDLSIKIPEMKRGVLGVWENLGGRVLYICVLLNFHDHFFNVFWGGTWVAPLPLSPSM
jgi:hypothetical protein